MKFIRDVAVAFQCDDCLPWPYARNNMGYGKLRIGKRDVLAHRLVCQIAHGSAPTFRHVVAHSCGKGHEGCVNPRHLRWATQKENRADQVAHGTAPRGDKQGAHKLSWQIVRAIRQRVAAGESQRHVAADYGIAQSNVSLVASGRTWKE